MTDMSKVENCDDMRVMREIYEAIVGQDEDQVKRAIRAALILAGWDPELFN